MRTGRIRTESKTLNDEYVRRGGWTRALLVTNGNGHVHSSMSCSTCDRGGQSTQFQWLVEFSDHDESEVVAAAGWRACTGLLPVGPRGRRDVLSSFGLWPRTSLGPG